MEPGPCAPTRGGGAVFGVDALPWQREAWDMRLGSWLLVAVGLLGACGGKVVLDQGSTSTTSTTTGTGGTTSTTSSTSSSSGSSCPPHESSFCCQGDGLCCDCVNA